MDEGLIKNLLTIINQLKYYHWETTSYARHMALGSAYDSLNELIDEFVEILLGKYGRELLKTIDITVRSKGDVSMESALIQMENYLIEMGEGLDQKTDTDLINIRDEMLGVIKKTKYLFTLK